MKKAFCYTLMASILMVSAGMAHADTPVSQPDATEAALTTKGYVDTGLKYVYDTAKDAKDKVDTLSNQVGDTTTMGTSATTITGAIKELDTAIQNIKDGQEYTAGTGIDVSDSNVVSIDLGTTPATNATYVFKTDATGNGSWQTVEVEDSWNPGFLDTVEP